MVVDQLFLQKVETLKEDVRRRDDVTDAGIIEKTALRLERLQYFPPVNMAMEHFLRLTTERLFEEIDKIIALPEHQLGSVFLGDAKKYQDVRLQCIAVQIYYYKKLILLRQDDMETWDEIDELYVHD